MKHPFLIFLLFLCGGFSAVAQPSGNPLVFGENRLTLITPTLFRLEFAHDGKFIDDPTYFAYDRGSLLPASGQPASASADTRRTNRCFISVKPPSAVFSFL